MMGLMLVGAIGAALFAWERAAHGEVGKRNHHGGARPQAAGGGN